ncbi:MAG: prolyl aminopeptidase [Alphaproteobacteria bacterium]|nr:prolyl aminopeptidase [Alphaproteobacteria bacterium]MDE2336437.1 prolyl aminopeptidase [Alphaproteobacteria bacterium]
MQSSAALYPPVAAFDSGFLKAGAIHALYYEQSGNPQGVPVVYLHGGPGAGAQAKHRQFFDPGHYRIVIFDQRGAGRSKPAGELRENTTADLVADMERLREHLGIKRWHLFGGSWGSTLALAYAIAHPERVLGMTLRGIFMMRQGELDHFLYGMRSIFPEAWEDFVSLLDAEERDDILASYYKRLTHPDRAVHLPAAEKWSGYESACLRLIPETPAAPSAEAVAYAYAVARLECHYFVNNRFDPDEYLLRNVWRIRHIPCVIVQGRYDIVCPPVTAHDLHTAWPEAQYVIVPDAGHSSSEPGIVRELVKATDFFRTVKS